MTVKDNDRGGDVQPRAALPAPTAADYEAATAWAKNGAKFHPDALVTGEAAREAGRALLRGAGRPALDPKNEPGEESPQRRVRLPQTLNAELDAYLAALKEQGARASASDVLREALVEYLRARQAS